MVVVNTIGGKLDPDSMANRRLYLWIRNLDGFKLIEQFQREKYRTKFIYYYVKKFITELLLG